MNSELSNGQVRSSNAGVIIQSDDDTHTGDVGMQVDVLDTDGVDEDVVNVDVLCYANAQAGDDIVVVYKDDTVCMHSEDDAVHLRCDVVDGCTHDEVKITHNAVITGRRPTRNYRVCCEDVIVVLISLVPKTCEGERLESANDAGAYAAGYTFVEEAGCCQARGSCYQRQQSWTSWHGVGY